MAKSREYKPKGAIRSKPSRAGLVKFVDGLPENDNGIYLDRPINDTDIWVVLIDGKREVCGLSEVEKMERPIHGKVLMRFVDKMGCKCEKFNINE